MLVEDETRRNYVKRRIEYGSNFSEARHKIC